MDRKEIEHYSLQSTIQSLSLSLHRRSLSLFLSAFTSRSRAYSHIIWRPCRYQRVFGFAFISLAQRKSDFFRVLLGFWHGHKIGRQSAQITRSKMNLRRQEKRRKNDNKMCMFGLLYSRRIHVFSPNRFVGLCCCCWYISHVYLVSMQVPRK